MPPPVHGQSGPAGTKTGTRRQPAPDTSKGGWFRCKAGAHAQMDETAEKDETTGLYPVKQFGIGERFYHKRDLVALNPAKYERVNAPRGFMDDGTKVGGPSDAPNRNTFTFPSGQVPDGFQETGGAYQGDDGVRSGHDEDREAAATVVVDDDSGHVFRSTAEGQTDLSDADVNGETEPDYHAMTVADLKAYAEEEEIELHGKTSKADIVRTIRAAGGKKGK